MNKAELVAAISEKANVTKKQADAVHRALTDTVDEAGAPPPDAQPHDCGNGSQR